MTLNINLSKVPSSDPLAFISGLMKGFKSKREEDKILKFKEVHGSNYRDLAPEYIRGFKFGNTGILLPEGTKIYKGTMTSLHAYDVKEAKIYVSLSEFNKDHNCFLNL